MHRLLFITLLAFLLTSCSAYETTSEVITENFDDGSLKRETQITTKKYTKFDLHTYFTQVKTYNVEYHENGTKKLEYEQVWKSASWGKPCKEVTYWEKTYYENGTLKSERKNKCDMHEWEVKEYNEAGEITFKKEVWSSYGEKVDIK